MRMRTVLAIAVPLLWLGTLGSAVQLLVAKQHARMLTTELSQERARRDRLELAWGQLQLERGQLSLATPGADTRPGGPTLTR